MDESEILRTPIVALEPDPRSLWLKTLHSTGSKPFDLRMRFEALERFTLHDGVPESVRVQFETARNLYLYAWFVYRFHMVAESQVLVVLELALRMRLNETFEVRFPKKRPTLNSLLRFARDEKLLTNEGLASRYEWAKTHAERRVGAARVEYMRTHNLHQLQYIEDDAVPDEEDMAVDWLELLIKALPARRNNLAHGTTDLTFVVLRTFDEVCCLINQLFPPGDLP